MNAYQIQAEAALVSWDPSDASLDAVRGEEKTRKRRGGNSTGIVYDPIQKVS